MPADSVSALMKYFADRIIRCNFLSYEQVSPQDSFGDMMKVHFEARRSPLRNLDDFPDLGDQGW